VDCKGLPLGAPTPNRLLAFRLVARDKMRVQLWRGKYAPTQVSHPGLRALCYFRMLQKSSAPRRFFC
jgi:hypothetical protein